MHRRLICLAQNSRSALLGGIVCGVLAGAGSLAQAYALSAAVDGIFLGHERLDQIWPWMQLLLGVIAVRGILLYVQEVSANEVAIRVKDYLRERLFAHLLELGPSFVRGERAGELTSTAVEGIESLDAYYSQYVPQVFVGVLVPATILVFVFSRDPLSALILLLTAPLIPFFMYMIGRTAELATQRQYQTLGRLASHFLDSLQGLTTLKIFGQSVAQAANIARVADEFRSRTLKVLQVSFLSAFTLELLATMGTAILAVEIGLRLLYGHMLFRDALFLLVLAPEFYLPLRMLGTRFHAGMAGTAAARRIFQVLDTAVPQQDGTVSPAPSASAATAPATIELRQVSYAYPDRDKPALVDINLAFQRGQQIALVGPSGSGKTTLAGLLLGFMQPTEGHILLDGIPLESLASSTRASIISWVPQNPYLFHDSIEANIRLGRPTASAEDVQRAVRLAHLDGLLASLPEGLATKVGEGGVRLSSGEAQRVALARAILMDCPTIILDEPTSSLDPENEAMVDDSLRRLVAGRTVVTIAHRLSTVFQADRILVLEEGRVVEQGTHAQLLAMRGAYASLIASGQVSEGSFAPGTKERSTFIDVQGATPLPISIGAKEGWATLQAENPPAPGRRVWPLLLGFLKGSWAWVTLSVVLTSLAVGSSIGLLGTSAWLISAAALHPSIASLEVAIVGVRFFGIARAAFRYLERLISHAATFRVLRNIRVWFYVHLEPLAPARLMDFRAGDLLARAVADVQTMENLYVRVLAPPVAAVCVGIASAFWFALNGAREVGVLLVALFLLAGLVVPFVASVLARRPGARMIRERAALHAQVIDGVQGLGDILAFGRGEDRLQRLRSTGAKFSDGQRSMARISALNGALTSMLGNLAPWLALLIIAPAVQPARLNGVMVATMVLMILASFEAVSPLPVAAQLLPSIEAAARRLLEVVDVSPSVAAQPVSAVSAGARMASARTIRPGPRPPALEVAGLSFAYPGRSEAALKDISFSIDAGRTVALVGPSGAGKSTIASLLLRFWDYEVGQILWDGTPLCTLDAEDVRARIAFVSPHLHFFDTSIFENLRLAGRGVTLQQVHEAARRAQIHDFIMSLPDGYDTLVGERGVRLSAGELQRLGIARLIIRDAPLLIVDEPTSGLDAKSEAAVLSTLFELMGSRTSLLITHRLLGMEHLNQILVIDHGAIVERGSHRSLLAHGGLYARLWTLQNRHLSRTSVPLAGVA